MTCVLVGITTAKCDPMKIGRGKDWGVQCGGGDAREERRLNGKGWTALSRDWEARELTEFVMVEERVEYE